MYKYTLENLRKAAKSEKGRELFEKYKVFEYLDTFYGVLHTTGHRYIINDIDLYIEARTTA
jgi:hypothetical protein